MNKKGEKKLNSKIEQTNDQKRIAQLNDVLNEIHFIEQELNYMITTGKSYIETQCEALRKETVKGINHIENNPNKNQFFFPEIGYMIEKTDNLKSFLELNRMKGAVERIEELVKNK